MLRKAKAWSLWRQPTTVVILVLLVDVAALLTPAAQYGPVTRTDIGTAVLLASLSIAYSLISRRWERARRALLQGSKPTLCPNLLAAWGFAAAVMLPPVLVAGVMLAAALAEWPARNISGQATPYRYVFSTAAAILGGLTAHAALSLGGSPLLHYPLAAVAYVGVNVVCIGLVVAASGHARALRIYLRPSSYVVDVCTLSIAAGQIALHQLHFPLLWLSLPATIAYQRFSVRADMRAAAHAADSDWSPMNEAAWLIAAREVIAALPVAAIMRIETTDPAAVSFAARMQAGCDAIGLVGPSSLAILLPDCPGTNAEALASRFRSALRHRGIEAPVAVAAKPRDGQSLADLLAVSEAELIARVAASRSARSTRPEL